MNQSLAGNTPNDWYMRERLARIFVVLFFFALEVVLASGFAAAIRTTAAFNLLGLSRLLASGCLLLFVAMMIALTIIRDQPRLQAPGSWPGSSAGPAPQMRIFDVGAIFHETVCHDDRLHGGGVASCPIAIIGILCSAASQIARLVTARRLG